MRELLRDILERHADALTLYARQFLDFHSAEEVVQDAIFRLLREKTPVDNPLAWLYKVVRNATLSRHRSDSRRRHRETRRASQSWFEPNASDRIDAEIVTEKLRDLPEELREILVLHLWSELSFAAIAELLGVSKATAFRKYEEGLKTLRKNIGESEP